MATPRRTRTTPRRARAYRGGTGRASGSGALLDTVKNTLTGFTGNRGRSSRGRGGRGGLGTQATGFISGFLSGGDSRGRGGRRGRGRRRR